GEGVVPEFPGQTVEFGVRRLAHGRDGSERMRSSAFQDFGSAPRRAGAQEGAAGAPRNDRLEGHRVEPRTAHLDSLFVDLEARDLEGLIARLDQKTLMRPSSAE